jgi:hypothetical protein
MPKNKSSIRVMFHDIGVCWYVVRGTRPDTLRYWTSFFVDGKPCWTKMRGRATRYTSNDQADQAIRKDFA